MLERTMHVGSEERTEPTDDPQVSVEPNISTPSPPEWQPEWVKVDTPLSRLGAALLASGVMKPEWQV